MKKYLPLALLVLVSHQAFASVTDGYVAEDDMGSLAPIHSQFFQDFVNASRTKDFELMKELFHSCMSSQKTTALIEYHFQSPVKAEFWVRIKAGKKPDSLYFKIKHKAKSQDSVDFKMFKTVVEENGKMKIKSRCKS